jgi:hypothetical protein
LVYLIAGGVILHPQRFLAHVRYVADFKRTFPIVQQSPEILVPLTPGGVLTLARENAVALVEAMGPVLVPLGLLGFVVGWRFTFVRLVAATVLGHIVLVLVPVQHVQYRYVMFLAYGFAFPAAWVLGRGLEQRGALRTVTAGLCLATAVHLAARGTDLTYQMLFDARRDAGTWLAGHAPAGTTLTYFGLVDQLPPLPEGTRVWQTPPDANVDVLWAERRPAFVLVIPDFSSTSGLERSRFLPEHVYRRLLDGSLGYRQVAHLETRPLFGRPLTYLPYVNSPVQIYARIDDAHAR